MADYTKPVMRVVIESEKEKPQDEFLTKKKNGWQEFAEGFKSTLKDNFKMEGRNFGETAANKIVEGFEKGGKYLRKVFKDAWAELGNMIDASLLSNADTRETALTYGLSAAEGYGFNQAKSLMGLRSEEDLMWMTDSQREKFFEMMEKYTDKYNELYDSGMWEEMLDFKYEWAEFKQDFLMQIIGLIMDNKDLIINTMEGLLNFTNFAMEALGWIVNHFGGGASSESDRARAVADILNYDNRSNITTVNMDNTYNNVSKADQEWLANVGEMTYDQIQQALKVHY